MTGKIIALLLLAGGGYLGYALFFQEQKLADMIAPLVGKNQDNIVVGIATKIDGLIASVGGSDKGGTTVLPLENAPTQPAPATPTAPAVAALPEAAPPATETINIPASDATPTVVGDLLHDGAPAVDAIVIATYQNLSNGIDSEILPTGRVISAQEEEIWRSGLTHRFIYQRYKTVEDIINERLSGSEPLLESALLSKKFWTRMRALIGLVNMGAFVSPELVRMAIAGARESLVANYFKRFRRENTAYERYVLRYTLRFVSARTRITILDSLLNNQDRWAAEYLNAAMNDPDPQVAAWTANNQHRLEAIVTQPLLEQEGQTVIESS